MDQNELTDQEKAILNKTASLWNDFLNLPILHPDDRREMQSLIHAQQALIMQRLAIRVHPEMFFIGEQKENVSNLCKTCKKPFGLKRGDRRVLYTNLCENCVQ
jgi:hypothetical protein